MGRWLGEWNISTLINLTKIEKGAQMEPHLLIYYPKTHMGWGNSLVIRKMKHPGRVALFSWFSFCKWWFSFCVKKKKSGTCYWFFFSFNLISAAHPNDRYRPGNPLLTGGVQGPSGGTTNTSSSNRLAITLGAILGSILGIVLLSIAAYAFYPWLKLQLPKVYKGNNPGMCYFTCNNKTRYWIKFFAHTILELYHSIIGNQQVN